MPAPLAPEKRDAILADIGSGLSRNQIARKHHVAASTVGSIAAKAGLGDTAFDRTHTLKGARAKAADNKAKRTQLQSDLLDDAQKLRARAWAPYSIPMPGAEGPEIITLELPPLIDVRAAYTSIGVIVDKDLAYERSEVKSDGAAAQRSLLGRLLTGLGQAIEDDVPSETPQDEG